MFLLFKTAEICREGGAILGQENSFWPYIIDFVSINPILGGKCRNRSLIPS